MSKLYFSCCRGPLDSRGEHRQPEHLRNAHLRVHGQGRPRVVRAETSQRGGGRNVDGLHKRFLAESASLFRSPFCSFVSFQPISSFCRTLCLSTPLPFSLPCRCPVEYEIMGEFEYSSSKTTALVHFQVMLRE